MIDSLTTIYRNPEHVKSLLKRGIGNPRQVLPYVLSQGLPNSRWGPEWRKQNGVITCVDGGFAGGSPTRPELSARLYYEVNQLQSALDTAQYDRSLEIGCGYGRLSGWISQHAETNAAIEPNRDAITEAHRHYPHIDFQCARVEQLPYESDTFDLIVSCMVLSHVPSTAIEDAIAELKRVAAPSCTVLLWERTRGEPGQASWPRSSNEYEELFEPFTLVTHEQRKAEPTWEYVTNIDMMLLTAEDSGKRAESQTVLE